MGTHDSTSTLPSHTPGTPKGEERVQRSRPRARTRRRQERADGARFDEHQRRGSGSDRPQDAAPPARLKQGVREGQSNDR